MALKLITSLEEMHKLRADYQSQGLAVALVPTMGALHEGHLSLVKQAKELAPIVGISIFVNPLQFAPGEDYNKYPRTLASDLEQLAALNIAFVFAPEAQEVYAKEPEKIKAQEDLANCLCGLTRPGHFDGVCTVVKILFDIIRPNFAVFGEKDFQQLKIIEAMVKEYNIPVKIIPGAIVREENGLAMSSRNKYLSDADRKVAANLYKALQAIQKNPETLQAEKTKLENLGIQVEYLEIQFGRIFIAARLGSTRLIDNITI